MKGAKRNFQLKCVWFRLRFEYPESERNDNATLLGGSETLPDTYKGNKNTTVSYFLTFDDS